MTWQKTSQVKASLLDAHAAIQVLLSPELELKAPLSQLLADCAFKVDWYFEVFSRQRDRCFGFDESSAHCF